MEKSLKISSEKNNRRKFGEHLTPTEMFLKFIFPEIKKILKEHIWVDLYCGEGNLILPILKFLPREEREEFFKKKVYLFDVQKKLVTLCIENAIKYGIQRETAETNIQVRDNLCDFPDELKKMSLPIFHITNPPYLYLGYIRKHEETQKFLQYFKGGNKGYQDLYQIAMMNDLRNQIEDLVYIIPSNFLFGASVSNKFRNDFLHHYKITKMYIFESKMFRFTGTNICIGFFKRKHVPDDDAQQFKAKKYKKNNKIFDKEYQLIPKFKYRAGSEFNEFCEQYKMREPLTVKYYLLDEEVQNNRGDNEVKVIDANKYENGKYQKLSLKLNDDLRDKIESNILFVQTVDKGSIEGRLGLGTISNNFNVKGIYVSKNTYRTHPIQIFLEPPISIEVQILLMKYFNLMLENFRKVLDSEFLTTYKYSDAFYTRKYLGLTQVRMLIETFPVIINHDNKSLTTFKKLVLNQRFEEILEFLKELKFK